MLGTGVRSGERGMSQARRRHRSRTTRLPHLDLPTTVVDQVDENGTDDGTEDGHDSLDRTVLVELTGGDAALAVTIRRDFVDV